MALLSESILQVFYSLFQAWDVKFAIFDLSFGLHDPLISLYAFILKLFSYFLENINVRFWVYFRVFIIFMETRLPPFSEYPCGVIHGLSLTYLSY
jgi:hypothetical protein